jgi:hypothetical protein
MAEENSVNDIFRFIQLRPVRTVNESLPIPLIARTALVERLAGAGSVSKRIEVADDALSTSAIKNPADVPHGPQIAEAVRDLRQQEDATTADLRARLPALENPQLATLSDVLLAAFYATRGLPQDLAVLEDIYRVYHLPPDNEAQSLAEFLRRPLMAPPLPRRDESIKPASPATYNIPDDRIALHNAINELVQLDRGEMLERPDDAGATRKGVVPFTLNPAARALLSPQTNTVLKARGIDPALTPIDVAVQALVGDKLALPHRVIKWPRPPVIPTPGVTLPPPPAHALVRPAGVADLMVVKQQIKRYERSEIAHVENVLIGEKKSRAHRQLERSEETFLRETESTRTQETELETADRFELNRESQRTIKNDQQVGFGLSLSGKYGPTVEFSSTFSVQSSSSQEETARNSSRYARDVVSRSLERLTERVREVRTRTIIRETEETNLHELHNETANHVSGIYQFLDKIYEAQVFNYGIREMFDFMIPEPASFWWYIDQNPTLDIDLPPAPEDLDSVCPDASYLTEELAIELAAEYGADIEGPPPLYVLVSKGMNHGGEGASEEDQPRSVQRAELTVPAGYRVRRARIRVLAISDENPVVAVAIGSERALWQPAAGDRIGLHNDTRLAHQPVLFMGLETEPYELTTESKLAVAIIAFETNTYTIEINVVALRMPEHFDRWKLATYKKIRAAWEDRVREHEQKVAELRTEAEAKAERVNRLPFGAPPGTNRQTVHAELKKHCISMITQQRYDAFDATKDGTPPYFDFVEAAAEGSYIRFFEQAFEWDQMQYVFYPYFWARKTTWVDRFTKQEIDPLFLEFLRAGSARVVVPVRPGFEVAVTHFLETGKLWGGEGEPPSINSPLYVSIIDEIRERTGAPQGEIPVGEPWDARVPTALVLVRPNSDLPRWRRTAPDVWNWLPEETEE